MLARRTNPRRPRLGKPKKNEQNRNNKGREHETIDIYNRKNRLIDFFKIGDQDDSAAGTEENSVDLAAVNAAADEIAVNKSAKDDYKAESKKSMQSMKRNGPSVSSGVIS